MTAPTRAFGGPSTEDCHAVSTLLQDTTELMSQDSTVDGWLLMVIFSTIWMPVKTTPASPDTRTAAHQPRPPLVGGACGSGAAARSDSVDAGQDGHGDHLRATSLDDPAGQPNGAEVPNPPSRMKVPFCARRGSVIRVGGKTHGEI